eukprot:TRINITY_DN38116_c0_g2_i1.p1 TRINITY_DN38116_c0_g2~~TRINITY_DN38116_c0_g2_i1.p1  ORF type:complete len:507 (+),score=31.65 TRINITY_DN38116_c0_g2_i1:69-1589(+)
MRAFLVAAVALISRVVALHAPITRSLDEEDIEQPRWTIDEVKNGSRRSDGANSSLPTSDALGASTDGRSPAGSEDFIDGNGSEVGTRYAWAAAACRTVAKDIPPLCLPDMSVAAVLCCGRMTGHHLPTAKYGCHEAATHFTARSICKVRGLSLCSLDAVYKLKTCHAGCGFDRIRIWTSTGCEADRTGKNVQLASATTRRPSPTPNRKPSAKPVRQPLPSHARQSPTLARQSSPTPTTIHSPPRPRHAASKPLGHVKKRKDKPRLGSHVQASAKSKNDSPRPQMWGRRRRMFKAPMMRGKGARTLQRAWPVGWPQVRPLPIRKNDASFLRNIFKQMVSSQKRRVVDACPPNVSTSKGLFQNGDFQVLDNSPDCSTFHIDDPLTCGVAAASLGFKTKSAVVVRLKQAPGGCFLGHPGDNWTHVFFNEEDGVGRKKEYKSVCTCQSNAGTYTFRLKVKARWRQVRAAAQRLKAQVARLTEMSGALKVQTASVWSQLTPDSKIEQKMPR